MWTPHLCPCSRPSTAPVMSATARVNLPAGGVAAVLFAANSLLLTGTQLVNHAGTVRFRLRSAVRNSHTFLDIVAVAPPSAVGAHAATPGALTVAAVRLDSKFLLHLSGSPRSNAPDFQRTVHYALQRLTQPPGGTTTRRWSLSRTSSKETATSSRPSTAAVATVDPSRPTSSDTAPAGVALTKAYALRRATSAPAAMPWRMTLDFVGLGRDKSKDLEMWDFSPPRPRSLAVGGARERRRADAPRWRFQAVVHARYEVGWFCARADGAFESVAFEDVSSGRPRLIVHVPMEESAYHHLVGLWLTRLVNNMTRKAPPARVSRAKRFFRQTIARRPTHVLGDEETVAVAA
ncbi:hypothetical protein BROUX41_002624 [Berkeleyomyces rouxiae]|uniref:uncharacterized protein n=1 Tax=Berkeleyomyces rouxiae TaxID=2035830 RepID=UPI003B7AF0D9